MADKTKTETGLPTDEETWRLWDEMEKALLPVLKDQPVHVLSWAAECAEPRGWLADLMVRARIAQLQERK